MCGVVKKGTGRDRKNAAQPNQRAMRRNLQILETLQRLHT